MLGHAARGVPWARVVLAAGLVVVLMELVRWNPWVLWPLEGTAVGLLAGATAWCFDEQAAAVVDTSPRGLAWRTLARSPAVLLLAVAWIAAGLHADGSAALFGHLGAVLTQGIAAIAVGAGYTCWRRAYGEPMPGLLLATAIVPAAAALAVVRPFHERVVVFPYGADSGADWARSTIGWVAVGAVAVVVGACALADAPWWPNRRRSVRVGHAGRRAPVTRGLGQ